MNASSACRQAATHRCPAAGWPPAGAAAGRPAAPAGRVREPQSAMALLEPPPAAAAKSRPDRYGWQAMSKHAGRRGQGSHGWLPAKHGFQAGAEPACLPGAAAGSTSQRCGGRGGCHPLPPLQAWRPQQRHHGECGDKGRVAAEGTERCLPEGGGEPHRAHPAPPAAPGRAPWGWPAWRWSRQMWAAERAAVGVRGEVASGGGECASASTSHPACIISRRLGLHRATCTTGWQRGAAPHSTTTTTTTITHPAVIYAVAQAAQAAQHQRGVAPEHALVGVPLIHHHILEVAEQPAAAHGVGEGATLGVPMKVERREASWGKEAGSGANRIRPPEPLTQTAGAPAAPTCEACLGW